MRHQHLDNRGSGGTGRPDRAIFASQILLLLALWVAVHPYHGIIHDARLYLIQAINGLDGRFSNDLWFLYGSQDKFTVFSSLYKPIVALLGHSHAHVLVAGIGQVAWFIAALYLVNGIFAESRERLFAMVGIIVLNSFYDGDAVFKYGEPFATPRIYTETLVMVSLGLVQRGRLRLSSLPLLPAIALHPLMALPGIGVVALLAALENRYLWVVYAAVVVVGFGLTAAGIDPLARALMRFDNDWFDVVYQRSAFAFVTRWDWFGILGLIAHAAILLAALPFATVPERRLVAASLIVGAGGIAMTFLGGDLARNVLIVDLQPWRACWIMAVLSNAWTTILAWRLPKDWLSRDVLVIGMVSQAVVTAAQIRIALATPIFIFAVLTLLLERRQHQSLRGPVRYSVWLTTAVLVALVALGLVFVLWLRSEIVPTWRFVVAVAVIGAAAATLVVSATREVQRPGFFVLLPSVLMIAALIPVDHRDAWQKFIESPKPDPSLGSLIDNIRNIYWEDQSPLLWFKLGRPNYYSCLQGAGALFYRDTALEYRRRGNALVGLNTLDFSEKKDGPCVLKEDPKARGPENREQLVTACRALPELEAIVLNREVPGTVHSVWKSPATQILRRDAGVERISTFYMYRCADLR
jgi:hypothetical protein